MTTTTSGPRVLRDYQSNAVRKVHAQWDSGNNRTVVVHATGLGKTDVIAALALSEVAVGGRVLILAERGEPLDQITTRCGMHDPTVAVGRVQADLDETDRSIVVASVQTVRNDARLARLHKPTLVLVDECHHAMAASYQKVLRWAGCLPEVDDDHGRAHHPRPGTPSTGSVELTRLCGFTATLVRGDGRGFGELFPVVADTKDIEWAIENHWLVEPHGRLVELAALRLEQVAVRQGDYAPGELGTAVSRSAMDIVTAWQRHAAERITVAFTPCRASAASLHHAFRAAGVAAEVVVGTTPREDRALTYKRLAAGETRVLVAVMVPTEAWDCPPVSCVLIARPTRFAGLYQQMVGRGLRLCPEVGKTDCLVLDVAGVTCDTRMVTLADLYPDALYDGLPVPEATSGHRSGSVSRRGGMTLEPPTGLMRVLRWFGFRR